MNILAVNGSPRRNWNTSQLLRKVVEGAESKGAQGEIANLYGFDYSGCISCFLCKKLGGKNYGRCAVQDGLAPVLDMAHEADIVVLGSPIYFGLETGMMRSFMERFWFQYFLYSMVKKPLAPVKKAVALVYTMNVPEEALGEFGVSDAISRSQGWMERLFGSCDVLLSTNTLQFDDYSKYDHDYFDVPAKEKRHDEVFPQDLQAAFELGARMAS